MLKAVLQDQGLEHRSPTQLHNYNKPTYLNYSEETTTTRNFDFYKPVFTDWDKLLNMGGKLQNPQYASNVYVGAKNIYPEREPKNFTGLEMYSSGRNNKNILPEINTFSKKTYYTYI